MPGPRIESGGDPGISLHQTHWTPGKHVDGRVKPGHDEYGRGSVGGTAHPAIEGDD